MYDDDDDKEVEKKKYVQVSKLLIEMTFCLPTNSSFSASSSGQITSFGAGSYCSK